jgi:hemerythrin-like domain-containing protein
MTEPGDYTTETGDMFAVHAALQGAFDAAGTLVAGAGTDPDKVGTVASYYANVIEFLHVHHTGEDELVFPVLAERCPGRDEVIARVGSQHTQLDGPMAAADAALEAWRTSPTPATGAEAVARLAAIGAAVRPHFADEETEILPLASAYLNQEEWSELPGHSLRSFRRDKPWLALGLVRERLDEEHRARMLEGMPPPVRQRWLDEGEPAFVSFIAEVRAVGAPA